MSTQIVVPTINRPVTDALFTDITTSEYRMDRNVVDEYIITFVDDLTPGQVEAISRRCALAPEAEDIRSTSLGSIPDLQAIIDADSPDLVAAVKLLAQNQIANIKVLYGQTDA